MAMTWTEYVRAFLMARGLNHGAARDRVVEVLAGQPCAVSAAEIEVILREHDMPTARASIYRALDLLVDYGLVERVVLGSGQARFERLEYTGDHHHHLVCDRCGELFAFDDPVLEQALSSLPDRLGMQVQSHDVTLHGACGHCA